MIQNLEVPETRPQDKQRHKHGIAQDRKASGKGDRLLASTLPTLPISFGAVIETLAAVRFAIRLLKPNAFVISTHFISLSREPQVWPLDWLPRLSRRLPHLAARNCALGRRQPARHR